MIFNARRACNWNKDDEIRAYGSEIIGETRRTRWWGAIQGEIFDSASLALSPFFFFSFGCGGGFYSGKCGRSKIKRLEAHYKSTREAIFLVRLLRKVYARTYEEEKRTCRLMIFSIYFHADQMSWNEISSLFFPISILKSTSLITPGFFPLHFYRILRLKLARKYFLQKFDEFIPNFRCFSINWKEDSRKWGHLILKLFNPE